MEFRILPKILLWVMLVVSTMGAISSLLRPATDQTALSNQDSLKQQMAVYTATSFAREWMTWSGDELPEDRLNRLKPYVDPTALSRIGQIKAEQKTSQQKVTAAEFVSLTMNDAHLYTVRVRVVVMNPARTLWEVDIPVWVQLDKGASVTTSPIIRPLDEAPVVPESKTAELSASNEVKGRIRPAIESFLKAICEGKDAVSLFNYVSTGSKLNPLQGKVRFISLDGLKATGTGPYTVNVTFSVQDPTTGIIFTQEWKLTVTEENQKFFVGAIE